MESNGQTRNVNSLLNLKEFYERKLQISSRPQFLVVELTQDCNLHCQMCREEGSIKHGRKMPITLFKRIAQELFPFAKMVDLRGWGESLILPNIIELIELTASYSVKIRFVSNLTFHRPEVIKALAKHGCYIAVSIDTVDPILFRVLRGGARLEQVTSNLHFLVEQYRMQMGSADRIHLTTTIQAPAVKGLVNLIELAAQCQISEVRLFPVTVKRGSPLQIDDKPAEVDLALIAAAIRARDLGVRLIAGTRLGSMPENRPDIPPCIHPWAYSYISYNGGVSFCDHLIGKVGEPYQIGNLMNIPFDEIWNGDAWQSIRREHIIRRSSDVSLFQECAWCYKNRYIDFEHYFDPKTEKRIVSLSDHSFIP